MTGEIIVSTWIDVINSIDIESIIPVSMNLFSSWLTILEKFFPTIIVWSVVILIIYAVIKIFRKISSWWWRSLSSWDSKIIDSDVSELKTSLKRSKSYTFSRRPNVENELINYSRNRNSSFRNTKL